MIIYTLLFKGQGPIPPFSKPFLNELDMRKWADEYALKNNLNQLSFMYGNCDETGEDDIRLVDSKQGHTYYFILQKHELEDERFPNGLDSWKETHYIVSSRIESISDQGLNEVVNNLSTGERWDLAKLLTDEFENQNSGREWDGEFFDELDDFINSKLY